MAGRRVIRLGAVSTMQVDRQWHLDKRIPLSLIATIVVQSFLAAWWAAGVTSDVSTLKAAVEMHRVNGRERDLKLEHVSTMEADLRGVREMMLRMEAALQRITDRQGMQQDRAFERTQDERRVKRPG